MAKKDKALFDRLRRVGLRKQAAKALSQVSENAGKKAERTARAAVKELRALADEIERRLPDTTLAPDATGSKRPAARPARPSPRPSSRATPGASRRPTAARPSRATTATPKPGATTRPPVPPPSPAPRPPAASDPQTPSTPGNGTGEPDAQPDAST